MRVPWRTDVRARVPRPSDAGRTDSGRYRRPRFQVGGVDPVRLDGGREFPHVVAFLGIPGQLVHDLARLTLIRQAATQRVDQPETPIRSLEQQRTAVGTAVFLVELGNDGLVQKIREQQTLCRGMLGHVKASGVLEGLLATAFYHTEAFRLSKFVNYPG